MTGININYVVDNVCRDKMFPPIKQDFGNIWFFDKYHDF